MVLSFAVKAREERVEGSSEGTLERVSESGGWPGRRYIFVSRLCFCFFSSFLAFCPPPPPIAPRNAKTVRRTGVRHARHVTWGGIFEPGGRGAIRPAPRNASSPVPSPRCPIPSVSIGVSISGGVTLSGHRALLTSRVRRIDVELGPFHPQLVSHPA